MNAELISWVIIAEVSLPFVVLSFVLIVMLVKGRSKNKEAVRKLILQIKSNEDSEKNKLQEFLNNKVGSDEKTAKAICKKIINERKFLFRNLISGVLDKNSIAITGLDEDLSRITDHYHSLKINSNSVIEPENNAAEEIEDYKETIDDLKKELKTLKHEVHVTLTTLNNIFGEFSSMFGEEVPDRELSVDQIITAMEAFATKSDSDAEETMGETNLEVEEIEELDVFAEMEEDINFEEENDASSITEEIANEVEKDEEMDFSIDNELDDIDSALDDLELGASPDDDEIEEEPSWDDAFEESGDTKSDER